MGDVGGGGQGGRIVGRQRRRRGRSAGESGRGQQRAAGCGEIGGRQRHCSGAGIPAGDPRGDGANRRLGERRGGELGGVVARSRCRRRGRHAGKGRRGNRRAAGACHIGQRQRHRAGAAIPRRHAGGRGGDRGMDEGGGGELTRIDRLCRGWRGRNANQLRTIERRVFLIELGGDVVDLLRCPRLHIDDGIINKHRGGDFLRG